MAAFSVNQVRQLYVANAYKENLNALANVGDITAVKTNEGDAIYFQYKGALADIMRTDLIKIDNITNLRATRAEDLAYKIKGYTLVLDSAVNSGNPVAGQDYILRLAFREYIGISEADQYFKYGMVHAYSGMTPDTFYKEMALSLVKNIEADIYCKPAVIYVHSASKKSTDGYDANGYKLVISDWDIKTEPATDIDKILIEEAVQPWILGTMPQGVIPFSVQPTTILVDGDSRIWGSVEEVKTDKVLPEGQLIADLEYFCMGERGDQYRYMGWPNVIPTKYLVDPSKTYDVVNIHYFYQGDGISVQKSEKDIQIVVPRPGDKDYTNINALINAIKTLVPGTVSANLQELS